MKQFITIIILAIIVTSSLAQEWQQRADYSMTIDMDVKSNRFTGNQQLEYFNNSPDTLKKVYFHLYFNAFQPNSMMDVRSRSIEDPDRRVRDRIYHLSSDEIGYQKIKTLKQGKSKLDFQIEGTILTAYLKEPILPNSKTSFSMNFEAQVPLQIRRTGRDNAEGVRYSMAQWYPKIAAYDVWGWHADDYIGREFYGPLGNYDVKITIDADYTIASTGVLQNPEAIGKGYQNEKVEDNKKTLTYHFSAPNVHDFVWAADNEYQHDVVNIREGLDFHYFYKKDTLEDNWKQLQEFMSRALPFVEAKYGKYPYPIYSIIQGGDGGMEYPMATLVTGHRQFESLLGTTVHELMHEWYQTAMATDERQFAWMDEGFTTYTSSVVMDFLYDRNSATSNPVASAFRSYQYLVKTGKEEALTTHADHFCSNLAYGIASYSKGAIFLQQLRYIIGDDAFDRGMLRYYDEWKFKHPKGIDFLRVMEKESDIELDWYYDYWVSSIKTIDYGIREVYSKNNQTHVILEKMGKMPMPLDLKVVTKDGKESWYHIALSTMRGHKKTDSDAIHLSNWPWVNDYYSFDIPVEIGDIKNIEIDPYNFTTDTDVSNNKYPLKSRSLEINGSAIEVRNKR